MRSRHAGASWQDGISVSSTCHLSRCSGRFRCSWIESGPTYIAKYRYNGLGFRIMSQEDDNASGSLDAAEKRFMMYDERWRVVATFRDQDAAPKETYVYHAAGWNGSGDAAYIDSVILRDRDNTACGGPGCDPRLAASDGTLEERRFYCRNWRVNVLNESPSVDPPRRSIF